MSYQDPNEVFEIYNHRGKKIGRARRSEVHGNPKLIHRAVHVFVFNAEGAFYLQKRSEDKDVQPGKWDMSVGGHLNLKESYLQAAKREMEEELGIRETDLLTHLYDYEWRTEFESEDIRTYATTYLGEFQVNPQEISEGRFWTKDEILASVGTGVLTPNFEKEMELYQKWSGMI